MKSMCISFMTNFYRAGGGGVTWPPSPLDPVLQLVSVLLLNNIPPITFFFKFQNALLAIIDKQVCMGCEYESKNGIL